MTSKRIRPISPEDISPDDFSKHLKMLRWLVREQPEATRYGVLPIIKTHYDNHGGPLFEKAVCPMKTTKRAKKRTVTAQEHAVDSFRKHWQKVLQQNSFYDLLVNGINVDGLPDIAKLAEDEEFETQDKEFYRLWHALEACTKDPDTPASVKA